FMRRSGSASHPQCHEAPFLTIWSRPLLNRRTASSPENSIVKIIISSPCLVEIKTLGEQLVEKHRYRPDCWRASRELSGGIPQSQKTVQKTICCAWRELD